MPFIAKVAEGRINELSIFSADYPTSDGTGLRDYINVMDLEEGHLAALRYLASQTGFDVFNLGTGKGITVLELIDEFQKALAIVIKYKIVGRREGD